MKNVIQIRGYQSNTKFLPILDTMSYPQFYADQILYANQTHLSSLTEVQRRAYYREKWANKQVMWTGTLGEICESGGDVILTINVLLGYTSYTFNDENHTYSGTFKVRMPSTKAGDYLRFNKGDEITVKGGLPPEQIDCNNSNLLLNCTVERCQSPQPKKKSFWNW